MWLLVTTLDKKQQAIAVALSLSEKKNREVAMEVPIAELKADDGMAKLLGKQNGGSNKDSADEVYESFEAFDSCAKTDGANISDFFIWPSKEHITRQRNMK